MDKNTSWLLSGEILIMLFLQIPVNIFFYLLYQPYVIRPYTNMLYFFILCIVGYLSAKKYGNLEHLYDKKSGIKSVLIGTILMIIIYLIMKYRIELFGNFQFFQKIQKMNEGHWQFFTKPWHEINIFLSVAGIFLVVVAMEFFYRAYIQELLNKYFQKNAALLGMSILSGLHSAVLGTTSGFVDFSLALIWGWVYSNSGLYGAIFVHMVWDILFIYFPGK